MGGRRCGSVPRKGREGRTVRSINTSAVRVVIGARTSTNNPSSALIRLSQTASRITSSRATTPMKKIRNSVGQ